jgi:glucose/arabinose dehydrogenase
MKRIGSLLLGRDTLTHILAPCVGAAFMHASRYITRGPVLGLVIALSCPAPAQTVPTGFQYQPVVTSGLQAACAMAFAPDGRLFVCDRLTGFVRVVRNGQLEAQPWHSVGYAQAPIGESGLLGIAVDPQFLSNGFVYLFYTDPNGAENRIARVRDVGGVGTQATVLSPGGVLPTHPNRIHNGGRMAFGHDGRLYVSTGDVENHFTPQDPNLWPGKILRFDVPNLTPAAGNPTPGNPVYALGMRNTFGLAVHPTEGWLMGSENGYLIGDEVNRIVAGGNYGWPQYEGGSMPATYENPLLTIFQQPALTGIAFYAGTNYPAAYQGCLFVCHWLDGQVRRLTLSATGTSLVANDAFADHVHAFDVQLGPDGNLWVLHGPGLVGATEIGRYLHTNAPAPGLHLGALTGPSLGGSVTFGVTAQTGDLVLAWVSLVSWQPPVPTPYGPIGTPADAMLPVAIVAADDRCYVSAEFPNISAFVGLPLHAQAMRIEPATSTLVVTNTTTHVLR